MCILSQCLITIIVGTDVPESFLSSPSRIRVRPVASLAHQEGRRVFREGRRFFELCPIFLNYLQHLFPGRENFSRGDSPYWRPTGYGPGQSHKPFESVASQSHLKFFRVRDESWLARVESKELSSHFELLVCKLESMSSQIKSNTFPMSVFAIKWRPIWCPTN